MKNNNIIINNSTISSNPHETSPTLESFIIDITRFTNHFTIANNYDPTDTLLISFNDILLLLKRTLNAYHALSTFSDPSFLIETHLNFMNRLFKKGLHITAPICDIKPSKALSKQQPLSKTEHKKSEIAERYKKEHSYHIKYQKNLQKRPPNNTSNNNSINISNISYNNLLTNSITSKDSSNVFGDNKQRRHFVATFKPNNRSGGVITTLGQISQQKQERERKWKSMSRNEKKIRRDAGDAMEESGKGKRGIGSVEAGDGKGRMMMTCKVENLCNWTGRSKERKREGDVDGREVIFTCVNSRPTKYAHNYLEKGYDILQQFERNNNSREERHNRCKSVY